MVQLSNLALLILRKNRSNSLTYLAKFIKMKNRYYGEIMLSVFSRLIYGTYKCVEF